MNDQFQHYLQKSGDEITLLPDERARMRQAVRTYMLMRPVPGATAREAIAWSFNVFSLRPIAAILIGALFISSAGISYAAEDALPGDTLYTIKTVLNEPLRGALAVTAHAKAEWASDVAAERIKEAAALAADGRLDASTEEKLQESFDTHAAVAIATILQEANTSPDTGAEAAVRLEAQLSEYERVLTQVGNATGVATAKFASAIRSQQHEASLVRVQAETDLASAANVSSSSTAVTASRMRTAAKAKLHDSLKLARSVGNSLTASTSAQVDIQLAEAGSTIVQGENLLATDAAPAARGNFQNALVAAEKLHVFLKTSAAIHERTGLVFAEPKKGGSPQKPSQTSKTAGSSAEGEVRAAATLMTTLSATSEGTTPPTETRRGQNGQGSQQGEINISATTQHDAEVEVPSLPVSVPVNLPN